MKIIFGGIAWFLVVFVFHLILWRIRVPKKPFKVLFFVVLYTFLKIKFKMKSIFFTVSMGIIRFFSMCINIILRCIKI